MYPIAVTSSTQRRMPPRAQTSFRRIVLDGGDAPLRWNTREYLHVLHISRN